jgi:hypothetical protein
VLQTSHCLASSNLAGVQLSSVLLRGLAALFGTLIFAVALALAVGDPNQMIFIWMLSFAFAWVVWVWLPERTTSRTRWWLTKTAQFAAVVLALCLLVFLLQVLTPV